MCLQTAICLFRFLFLVFPWSCTILWLIFPGHEAFKLKVHKLLFIFIYFIFFNQWLSVTNYYYLFCQMIQAENSFLNSGKMIAWLMKLETTKSNWNKPGKVNTEVKVINDASGAAHYPFFSPVRETFAPGESHSKVMVWLNAVREF